MKKIIAVFIAAFLILSNCLTAFAAAPIAIHNAAELSQMSENGNYYLANDITLSGNFSPLKTFSGTLDGRDKKLIGLKVSITAGNSATVYAGLFTRLDGGTVKNLTLEDVNITISGGGTAYVGAIVGKIDSGSVFNCRTGGKITVTADNARAYVGGIAGTNAAEIYLCESYVDITTKTQRILAGGIVGEHLRPDYVLEKCANFGQISASCIADTNFVGGIAGRTGNSVLNCANFGAVSVSTDINGCVGGIAGAITQGEIENCFNRGALSCTAKTEAKLDPIAAQHSAKFSNNYYLDSSVKDLNTIDIKTAAALESKNVSNSNIFSGFDFEKCWQMSSNGPTLRGITCPMPTKVQPSENVSSQVNSSGSSADETDSATSDLSSATQSSQPSVSSGTTTSSPEDNPSVDAWSSTDTPPIWIFIVIAVVLVLAAGAFLYFYEARKRK